MGMTGKVEGVRAFPFWESVPDRRTRAFQKNTLLAK
jgi:hypothetical protein